MTQWKNQVSKEDIVAFIDDLIGRVITLYLDGYEDAFVGVVKFAPPEYEFVALYDAGKCVQILAYELGYDWTTEEAFEADAIFWESYTSFFFRGTDPIMLNWWNGDDGDVTYLDLYGDAWVGNIIRGYSDEVALYDWNKCVEILKSNIGEENKAHAENRLSSTVKELFRETEPAFLFRFPGAVTSEERYYLD